jgi:HAD superfamily hydrolase (TIGR01490 family)
MTTLAFFDLDYTLLSASSSLNYVRELIRQRRVPLKVVAQIGLNYQLRRLDLAQAHAQLITYAGKSGYQATKEFFDEWVPRRLFPRLAPVGKARIEWHQQQGHRVVIISASIEEIIRPIAGHLGLGSDYLCTHLATDGEQYTGALAGPPCYGHGKVHWVKDWFQQNAFKFPEAIGYFYSDSSSDLPLLEIANRPVAVNPSRKLSKIAKSRHWAIEYFY